MRFLASLCLLFLMPNIAFASRFFDGAKEVPKIERHIEEWKMAEDTNKALDTIVKLAAKMMRDQRLDLEAREVERDWAAISNFLPRYLAGDKEVGDFAPWNDKLAALYKKIEGVLGPEICHWARIDDIKSILYTVPVVWHLDMIDGTLIDLHEYGLHWDGKESVKYNLGLAGTVAYWTSYAACTATTWGLGAVTFICMPAAALTEMIVEKNVAPRYRERLYERFYGRAEICRHGKECL